MLQEQFENNFARQLHTKQPERPIWVEDESLTIGRRTIPRTFWKEMQKAPLFDIQPPIEIRVHALVEEYGSLDPDFLVECTERIRKRLGPEQTKKAVTAIREERMEDFIQAVIVYYDKTYRAGLGPRDKTKIFPVPVSQGDAAENARLILEAAKTALWTPSI